MSVSFKFALIGPKSIFLPNSISFPTLWISINKLVPSEMFFRTSSLSSSPVVKLVLKNTLAFPEVLSTLKVRKYVVVLLNSL